jgi:hypothetical protein
MLNDVFFVAGNGAGCIWIGEYGHEGLIPPAEDLSAVGDCDEMKRPNAVVQISVNSTGTHGINVFQSGRVDLFTVSGKPRRLSVLDVGGRAVAFRPGDPSPSFAVSHTERDRQVQTLSRWDVSSSKLRPTGDFALDGSGKAVDYLGFSSDGELLVGVDTACALHYWDYRTRDRVYSRAAGALSCKKPSEL